MEAATALNDACVALCEGQYADIGFESRDAVSLAEYEAMIAGKTAALLGASMAIGAIAGGADAATTKALEECGRRLGMAFQVQDDVLGIWGDAALTGKPVADDIRSRKKSFPVAWAFEHLRGEAARTLARIYHVGRNQRERRAMSVVALLTEAGAQEVATATAARWASAAVDAVRGPRARCRTGGRHRSAGLVLCVPGGVSARQTRRRHHRETSLRHRRAALFHARERARVCGVKRAHV